MSLSKLERETIILFNEEEPTANIYTHNRRLINKLRRMAKAFRTCRGSAVMRIAAAYWAQPYLK